MTNVNTILSNWVFKLYRYWILHTPFQGKNIPLKWLFAPTPEAFFFSIRTTIAALIALVIAMWMELDSPAWAPMTVWIVAQGTRGESISKAKWRFYGTILGTIVGIALIAAFPQEWGLFFLALALWMALCSFLASFTDNFRAYAMVLAGYTAATISIDAISNPNDAFIIGMSRFTYITLGVVVETAFSALFSYNLAEQARGNLNRLLHSAIEGASLAIADLLAGDTKALGRSRLLFSTIVTMGNQIEFHEVELGSSGGHEGDHARAALSSISILLSRTLGLAARLKSINTSSKELADILEKTRIFFSTVPELLIGDSINPLQVKLDALLSISRKTIVDLLAEEVGTVSADNLDPLQEEHALHLLNERIIFQGLSDIYTEMNQTLLEFDRTLHPSQHDRFYFHTTSFHDPKEALFNGLRSAIFIIVGALVWEITAWPSFSTMLTLGALTIGRFSITDLASTSSYQFFKGTVVVTFVAFFLNFLILPTPATYEVLALCLFPPMFVAGLASRTPKLAAPAVAYNTFLPALIAPNNMGRINEVAFFNTALAILAGIWLAVTVFDLAFPFNPTKERKRLRVVTLSDLRHLAAAEPMPSIQSWIGRNVERFVRLIRHAGNLPTPVTEAYMQGTLSAMTIGRNVINLRLAIQRNQMPKSCIQVVQVVVRRMTQFTGIHGRTALTARSAIKTLRKQEILQSNISIRLEMTRVIASLMVISYELEDNKDFLDPSRTYHPPGERL